MRRSLVLLGLVLGACSDGPPTPTNAGDLLVSYFQGGPEAGAFLLTITGGPVDEVTALGGQQVSIASNAPGTTKVVVVGTLSTGELLKLRVPDATLWSNYVVLIEQVADKNSFALIDPAAYSFTVHR